MLKVELHTEKGCWGMRGNIVANAMTWAAFHRLSVLNMPLELIYM